MATTDFQDWELLHPSSAPFECLDSGEPFDGIESGGLIQVNYFSIDAQNRFEDNRDDDKYAAESDNPSWIDPGSEDNPTRYLNKEPCEFWSDSSSVRSDDQRSGEMEERKEMIFYQNDNKEVRVEGIGEILEEEGGTAENLGIRCVGSSGVNTCSPQHGGIVVDADSPVVREVSLEQNNETKRIESRDEVMEDGGSKENGELKNRGVVWWKMPVEFLKYCMFRMKPVWAVSIAAAAMMGFAILGRRLYKMKKISRGLEIKVTVDDKKLSQVTSRAARLNEAFSIVRRVPLIRPSLPAIGSANSWTVMSLR